MWASKCCGAGWYGFRDSVGEISWKAIFNMGVSAASSKYREWFQVKNDINIPN